MNNIIRYIKYPFKILYYFLLLFKSRVILASEFILEYIFLLMLYFLAFISRFFNKKIDVGIGPNPLINSIWHKEALLLYGWSVETFVYDYWFITNKFDYKPKIKSVVLRNVWLAIRALFRYRILMIYFDGGPLGHAKHIWKYEPMVYKIAGIKVLVLPFGGDVQNLMHFRNLQLKHAFASDYPVFLFQRELIEKKSDLWSKYAFVVSGCDWVYYTPSWDALMLSHFCVDTDLFKPIDNVPHDKFIILHAPNHRRIKGTDFLEQAVSNLYAKGYSIELKIITGVSADIIHKEIQNADLIVDQLVLGWYAMFAVEALASGKPVVCYLSEELKDLYRFAGLYEEGELPFIEARWDNIEEVLQRCLDDRGILKERSERARAWAVKYHSLEYVGAKLTRYLTLLDNSYPAPYSQVYIDPRQSKEVVVGARFRKGE